MIEHINRQTIIENSLGIWSFGQMGFGIKGPDAIAYIDLCLSNYVEQQLGEWWRRAYPPPVAAEAITNADYYFITHEHWDHLDPVTVDKIANASPQATFITGGWCASILEDMSIPSDRIITLNTAQRTQIGSSSIYVTVIPAAHYDIEHDDEKGHRWLGFIIEWNGVTLYHAGDTIIYEGYSDYLRQWSPIDIAIMPVNGRDYYRETEGDAIGNLLPAEVAQLSKTHEWDLLIPGHNDMYVNNMIPDNDIVAGLSHYAPQQKFKFMKPGEFMYYAKP